MDKQVMSVEHLGPRGARLIRTLGEKPIFFIFLLITLLNLQSTRVAIKLADNQVRYRRANLSLSPQFKLSKMSSLE